MQSKDANFDMGNVQYMLLILILASGCPPMPMYDGVVVKTAVVSEGLIRWNDNGQTGESLITVDIPEEGACSGTLDVGSSYVGEDGTSGGGALSLIPEHCSDHVRVMFSIRCNLPSSPYIRLTGGDLRQWVVGPVPSDAQDNKVNLNYKDSTFAEDNCYLAQDAHVSIVVDQAEGGAADMPEFVTADFKRLLRVEFDSGDPLPGSSYGEPCMRSMAVAGEIVVEIDATHFIYTEECCMVDCYH